MLSNWLVVVVLIALTVCSIILMKTRHKRRSRTSTTEKKNWCLSLTVSKIRKIWWGKGMVVVVGLRERGIQKRKESLWGFVFRWNQTFLLLTVHGKASFYFVHFFLGGYDDDLCLLYGLSFSAFALSLSLSLSLWNPQSEINVMKTRKKKMFSAFKTKNLMSK